jgi:hypothetical protein
MVAQPIFEGTRMYARTYEAVLCIAVTDAKGRRYALRHKAKTILAGIPPRPARADAAAVSPPKGFRPAEGVPVEECSVQTAPGQWLFVGPFADQVGKDAVKALGGPAGALLRPGQEIAFAGKTLKVAPVEAKFVKAQKGWQEDNYGNRHYHASCTIDIMGPTRRAQESVTCFYTVLHTDRPRTVEADIRGGKGVRVWLAGKLVRPGAAVRLAGGGYYPVLMRSHVGRVPAFLKPAAGFRLRDVPDPGRAYAEWLGKVAEARPALEEVLRDVPGSAEARRVKLLLGLLEPGGAVSPRPKPPRADRAE